METTASIGIDHPEMIRLLHQPSAYPRLNCSSVEAHETHISWVFLAGDFAYKIKKPITTSFLDFSTLEKRRHFCHEELRLDKRYAADLYVDVVPICIRDGQLCVEGVGEVIEYAVKMKRFPAKALLSHRLTSGALNIVDVRHLAETVANFHLAASTIDESRSLGQPERVLAQSMANLNELNSVQDHEAQFKLNKLKTWTSLFFDEHHQEFLNRLANGFVRECHGDLHLDNIVVWNDQLVPFDGIEFNDDFRWIDVLSDAAFLAMDLAARKHWELCSSFINSYLEATGDYDSLALLRWYLVYRALVRAKVAGIRSDQIGISPIDLQIAKADCKDHIDLGYRFSQSEPCCLWITHGLSGSGKTTLSEQVVKQYGAIRLRSDVHRKRLFDLSPCERPDINLRRELYGPQASVKTYSLLHRYASNILQAGYSVIVDATFLKHSERLQFESLAKSIGVQYAIIECRADLTTLRERIVTRNARNDDASDADLAVLDFQLKNLEPLTPAESAYVFNASTNM